MLASIGVYLLREQVLTQEVTVTSVVGKIHPPNPNLALEISYLVSPKSSSVYSQGDTIYAILYLLGNGTVNSIALDTKGFTASFVAPELPVHVDNFSNPQIIVLGITVLECCYHGNVSVSLS